MRIGIVGAGIMGRLLAWQLHRDGYAVSVFDRDPIDSGSAAAYTAAGMLTPYSELESTEWLICQMGMQGLQLWPQIMRSLDLDHCLQQRGSLVVAHHNDAADLQRFDLTLASKLPNKQHLVQRLDQAALAALEPELSAQFAHALYLPEECWLYNQQLLHALAKALQAAPAVQWFAQADVRDLAPHTIRVNGRAHTFDWVIDCRGLGAQPEIRSLRGVRGELIWVEAPEVNISRMVRLMHPRYRVYLVPNMRQRYVLGATQIESEDNSPISVRSALELLSALYCIHPGFAEARIVETKTNCRPALADNLPSILVGEGLLRINGLFRHGFLLAPAMAEAVQSVLRGHAAEQSNFPSIFARLAA